MKIWHAPPNVVFMAAETAGVKVVGYNIVNSTRVFAAEVTLKTLDKRYRRISRNRCGIVPGALCWHGFRNFMIVLFDSWPMTRLKSKIADYKNKEDFERKYEQTEEEMYAHFASSNPGSPCVCFEGLPYAVEPRKKKWRVMRFDGTEIEALDTRYAAEESAHDRNALANKEEMDAARRATLFR